MKGKLRYLLRLQPEAERQRFLWIHGEIGLPSYTEKPVCAVIPLSAHHGSPPLRRRAVIPVRHCPDGQTDAPPSLHRTHTGGANRGNAPDFFTDRRTVA